MNSKITMLALGISMYCSLSWGQLLSNTKHDFTRNSAATRDQMCVFCHVPRELSDGGGNTDAPLWNKKASSGGGFIMYSATKAGTSPDAIPNSSTLACLSCHDGTTAINSLNQRPHVGAGIPGDSSSEQTTVDTMATTDAAQIGPDLSNDHPVSIEYRDELVANGLLRPKNTQLPGSWLGAMTIQNLLRTDGAKINRVECVSCHDPHDNTNGMFLRVNNAGSALCCACHTY